MKFLMLFILIFTLAVQAKDYTKNSNTLTFIDKMVTEHNFKRDYLHKLFSDVERQERPLNLISGVRKKPTTAVKKKYPRYGAWDRYAKYKLTDKRIKDGAAFMRKYRTTFQKVEKRYGVPAEYIVAIIGIESVYGGNVGKYPVFDTLTTLAFEPHRRSNYFKRELSKFIQLSYRYKINPKNVLGSYAGAIGLGQFMPSNYEAYGIDFNEDGKVSLQHPQDAIASIANYLKENGWRRGEEVATRVSYQGKRFKQYKTGYHIKYNRSDLKGIFPKQGKWNYHKKVRLIKLNKSHHDELWYGAKNFYVITRYNHSAYYAMSVHKLAEKISQYRQDFKFKKINKAIKLAAG